jgi:ABC-type molybdate transport system substrate-binding protein
MCLAAVATLASIGFAGADEIRVISVGGVKAALDPIIAEFTKAAGYKVTSVVGSPAIAGPAAVTHWIAARMDPQAR